MAEELKEKDSKKKTTTKKSTTTTRKKAEGTAAKTKTSTKGTTRKATTKKKEVDDTKTVKKTTSKRTTTKKKEEPEEKKTAKKTTIKKTGTKSTEKKVTRVTGKSKKIVELEEVLEDVEELEEEEVEEALVVKKNPKDIVIDDKTMQTIEKEFEKQKSIPEKEQNKMNKKIFKNIIIGAVVVLYFIFVNLGFYNLAENTYLVDLQVFSAITIGMTIVIFERAYKKDSGELTIHGIEMLFLSILTLLTLFIHSSFYDRYTYIINSMATLFATYYAIKSTVIYVKTKKKAIKENSDVRKIIKK